MVRPKPSRSHAQPEYHHIKDRSMNRLVQYLGYKRKPIHINRLSETEHKVHDLLETLIRTDVQLDKCYNILLSLS